MIISGRTIVTEAGTPVSLAVDSRTVSHIDIFAIADQSGTIAVGSSTVSQVSGNESGIPLAAGDIITFTNEDLAEIYIDSSVVDEGVRWLAIVE